MNVNEDGTALQRSAVHLGVMWISMVLSLACMGVSLSTPLRGIAFFFPPSSPLLPWLPSNRETTGMSYHIPVVRFLGD